MSFPDALLNELKPYFSLPMKPCRKELVKAIVSQLKSPKGWTKEGDYDGEGKAFYPVLCRFFPPHDSFHIVLYWLEDYEYRWVLALISAECHEVIMLRQYKAFKPESINQSLNMLSKLDDLECLVGNIIAPQN